MQNIISLTVGAFVAYFAFFRKGGMGMGCCGSHGSHGRQSSHDRHGGHGHELDQDRHFNELSEDGKEDVIDLWKDQYTVLTVEEDNHPKAADRIVSQKNEKN